jgi:hypothetical protein
MTGRKLSRRPAAFGLKQGCGATPAGTESLHRELELIPGDRRCDQRHEIALNLRYRSLQEGKPPSTGVGTSMNIGRGGICFKAECEFVPGALLELVLEWPFLLQNRCQLELVIEGRVAWSEGGRTGLVMSHYEFRTRGARSFAHPKMPRPPVQDLLG